MPPSAISRSFLVVFLILAWTSFTQAQSQLEWNRFPDLSNPLGVAGPYVGVHEGVLVVAGGANFPEPVWERQKQWHDQIYVLQKKDAGWEWSAAGRLPRPIGYGATVSTRFGLFCLGGNDESNTYSDSHLLRWDRKSGQVQVEPLPSLPQPCAYGSATLLNDTLYFIGGQSDRGLESAMSNFWSLDISDFATNPNLNWKKESNFPGPRRAFHLTAAQHNGYHDCVYVMSGRRKSGPGDNDVEFLKDVWEYSPQSRTWRERRQMPECRMAGTALKTGQSHIHVFGGATGELFFRANELKDSHPGFPKQAWRYHTITDTWTSAGPTPLNQVTTIAVPVDHGVILASGEVRPRVRTNQVWHVKLTKDPPAFGTLNYVVLFGYLAIMLGVGVYFSRKQNSTNDYFRGGQNIPWWAAGCSIFATMLSSLTYTGIPSKAYAQDWVYAVGNFTIPLVAIAAAYVALPFFRRLDATSAYEYLEKRFNRNVRVFGSLSFTLFHLFRMAVVMSLTGLALAVATPLTPTQAVLLMGVLSIAYSVVGGIEAVIWTDTIQTFVLVGGAIVALGILMSGCDGGWSGFFTTAIEAEKLNLANFHWDSASSQLALWVVILGAVGQNISSYTADQAVVQRYTTTSNQRLAVRSIWTNALMTVPATLLFFGLGSALFVYYHSHPEKLDPTTTTDQIFPMFIAREMPAGIAGLLVAGIFAAAQSTVSTSMNSTATTVVTDLLRPLQVASSETSYLRLAQVTTAVLGAIGTLLALLFVDPEIKSLFDAFIKVIGLFMGVLGGLFLLGIFSRRANATGALTGAALGTLAMLGVWLGTPINGYLYTTIGIATCVLTGYFASRFSTAHATSLAGLTLYTMNLKTENGKTDE